MTGEITRAVQFIEMNYTREINASDAATLTGYSYHHFIRKFRAEVGRTFYDVIVELRIKHACRLLKESSLDMPAICERSGFNSQVQFYRMFKRRVGVTPMQYRIAYYLQPSEEGEAC